MGLGKQANRAGGVAACRERQGACMRPAVPGRGVAGH